MSDEHQNGQPQPEPQPAPAPTPTLNAMLLESRITIAYARGNEQLTIDLAVISRQLNEHRLLIDAARFLLAKAKRDENQAAIITIGAILAHANIGET